MKEFQHLIGDTAFPNAETIDVYAYENTFDYTRWRPGTKIKLLNVTWDSERNAVKFVDDAQRDAWFDAQKCRSLTLESAYHLLPNGEIKIPVPFGTAVTYNYVMVIFDTPTSEYSPIEYEDLSVSKRRYFFHIRTIEQAAPSTTRLVLEPDWWTFAINTVDISYMMLSRGHAPMAAANVDDYLDAPNERSGYLTQPEPEQPICSMVPRKKASFDINGDDVYACISTTCDLTKDFGSKSEGDWITKAASSYDLQNVEASRIVYAVKSVDLESFLNAVDSHAPQFKQSIDCVFFVSAKLIKLENRITFAGRTVYTVDAQREEETIIDLCQDDFAYPPEYSSIAKLYTYPYAFIEMVSADGSIDLIRIEDTVSGSIAISCCLSLVYPCINASCNVSSLAGAARTLDFLNVSRSAFGDRGRWYQHLKTLNIPMLSVVQDPAIANDYSTYYSREQTELAAKTANENANASAENAYDNVVASSATTVANTKRSSSAAISNTATSNAAASAITSKSNATQTTDTRYSNALNQALQAWDAGYSRSTTQAENDAQTQSAAVSQAQTAVSTIANVATTIASNPTPLGAVGAVGAVANGVAAGVGTGVNTAITTNLSSTKTELTIGNSQSKLNETNQNNMDRNALQTTMNTYATNQNNSAATAITSRNASTSNANAESSASTANSNAKASMDTTIANAKRTLDTTLKGIQAGVDQASIAAPKTFGATSNAETATTTPNSLFFNLVTVAPGDLKRCGDSMLRYGYTVNANWDVETLTPMSKFTYWRASELWITVGNGIIEEAKDSIEQAFVNGITVWKDPSEIGRVSIYDNRQR